MSDATWKTELRDVIRGASGGFLFGIPLVYTMEVWWIGSYAAPDVMFGVLIATFILVFLLNRTDGFRQISSDQPMQAAMDSVEAIAIGLLCVTSMLVLLKEITLSTPLDEALGKIIFENVPFCIGVALARSLLKSDDSENKSENASQKPSDPKQSRLNATFSDIGATTVGSIFIAFNIAPTDEVPMLSAATSPPSLLAIIASSLLISYCIVFAAGFTTQQQRLQQQGIFQHPLTETAMTYMVSLITAALMLWFFGQLNFSDPWMLWLRQTLILGLPATIGGAAGRLAV